MRLIDADKALRSLPDDLPFKGSVRRVLIQAPTVDAVSREEFRAAVNELCRLCGRYTREHDGACNGCKWRERRG